MREIIHCVECDEDRQAALAEIERLRDADPDSAEGSYRDALLEMVAKYESKGKPLYGAVADREPPSGDGG